MATGEQEKGATDVVLYGVILCFHYPLKATFALCRSTKTAVDKTASLSTRICNYAASTVSKAKATLTQGKDRVLAAVGNATLCATGFFSQLSVQNGGISVQDEPQSVYQKTLAKFQAAAFEQERQALKNEILKLTDGLKREFQCSKSDGDRSHGMEIGSLKDQIAEVQSEMSRFKSNFEREQNEFREERNNYRLEVHSLSQQFGEDKSKFDQMFKDLVGGFEREREVFREEIKTLLQRVADLRNSVQNADVTSNSDSNEKTEQSDTQQTIEQKIQFVEHTLKEIHDIKQRVSHFNGSHEEEDHIGGFLSKSLADLNGLDHENNSSLKKKRKESLRQISKLQEELKAKILKSARNSD